MDILNMENDYKEIMKLIKNNKVFNAHERDFFEEYINDIKEGKKLNIFYSWDFLKEVIISLVTNNYYNKVDAFNEIIELIKYTLPNKENSSNFEKIKGIILSGYLDIDKEIFSLFDNYKYYIDIIKILKNYELSKFEKILVNEFAIDVSPYCYGNEMLLKDEIISFIKHIYGDFRLNKDKEDYLKERLSIAQKRNGIYKDIDEKKLALVSSELKKIESLQNSLNSINKRLEEYDSTLKFITDKNTEDLENYSSSKMEELRKLFQELTSELSKTYQELSHKLKNDSNVTYNDYIIDIEKKFEELKSYVENDEKINACLKNASVSDELKDALAKMIQNKADKVESNVVVNNDFSNKFITRYSLDKEVDRNILYAFDESIPFNKRMETIMKEKERRKSNGEYFHKQIDEIIPSIIEGDWLYLWGPTGCGKSYLINQAASLLGINLITNGKITDKYDVMAYNDPHGRFRVNPTFMAVLFGCLINYDEFDNGNADDNVVLNGVYSSLLECLNDPSKEKNILFAEDVLVTMNPNFRMISAGNTDGQGGNDIFSSRKKIDESVQERQTPIYVDYDNELEKRIFKNYEKWYNFFVKFRKACYNYAKSEGIICAPGVITTRDAEAIVKYLNHGSKSVNQILRQKFIQTKDEEYLDNIMNYFKNNYNISLDANINIPDNVDPRSIDEKDIVKSFISECAKEKVRRR